MFGSSKLKEATNTTFKKEDYKQASFFSRYFTFSWVDPAINAANCDKKLTLEDCPDMKEAQDDISGHLDQFTQNYKHYESTKASRPFLRAFFYTFRWQIVRLWAIRTFVNGLNVSLPIISSYTYEIIKNEDKSEGWTDYIKLILAIEMLQYLCMPVMWEFYHT